MGTRHDSPFGARCPSPTLEYKTLSERLGENEKRKPTKQCN